MPGELSGSEELLYNILDKLQPMKPRKDSVGQLTLLSLFLRPALAERVQYSGIGRDPSESYM